MKKNDFSKLLSSIKEAGAIEKYGAKPSRAFHLKAPDVKAIRAKFKVSQADFALMLGVSPRTLQNWEQGRRVPVGPAKALLLIAQKDPEAVLRALY